MSLQIHQYTASPAKATVLNSLAPTIRSCESWASSMAAMTIQSAPIRPSTQTVVVRQQRPFNIHTNSAQEGVNAKWTSPQRQWEGIRVLAPTSIWSWTTGVKVGQSRAHFSRNVQRNIDFLRNLQASKTELLHATDYWVSRIQ